MCVYICVLNWFLNEMLEELDSVHKNLSSFGESKYSESAYSFCFLFLATLRLRRVVRNKGEYPFNDD